MVICSIFHGHPIQLEPCLPVNTCYQRYVSKSNNRKNHRSFQFLDARTSSRFNPLVARHGQDVLQ